MLEETSVDAFPRFIRGPSPQDGSLLRIDQLNGPLAAEHLDRFLIEPHDGPVSFGPLQEALVGELLGAGGTVFPEYQQERRELFDQGRYAEAAALWTPADRNELTVIKALAVGRRPRDAARAVGPTASCS